MRDAGALLCRQYKAPRMIADAWRGLDMHLSAVIGTVIREIAGDAAAVGTNDFQGHTAQVASARTGNPNLYRHRSANQDLRRQGFSDFDRG